MKYRVEHRQDCRGATRAEFFDSETEARARAQVLLVKADLDGGGFCRLWGPSGLLAEFDRRTEAIR